MTDFTQRAMQEFSYLEISRQLEYSAPVEDLWNALTGDLSAWWGAPYLKAASARGMLLEPRVGGRLIEVWGDNPGAADKEGSLWGIVSEIAEAELIEVCGPIGMPWPTQGVLLLELERSGDEAGAGSSLKLRHRAYGKLSMEMRDDFEFGWKDLLDKRLRAWLEQGERMGIGHEPMPWLLDDNAP
jgi:hypothetical protein